MSKSRVRSIMRRTAKATAAIQSDLKQVGKSVKKLSGSSPAMFNNVFGSLKTKINQGVGKLRGIGKTIKLRGRARGRTRGRGRARGRGRSRGRN